ncbi:malonyl-[acyl-carrier protein] O-methyltransferase BioC [Rickettsiella grylli]|uniref:malonyl-ACP O-methyltransferase BioC n=1 Tax=Rickettsiella grylli TaxID=59196 RepID=UPI0008FD55CF|nr:malonyl-ACP O-methyltransferase BioC [Rickettsiella grylli]OJA00521.1 malonyl-[acyl-carrier protein] O-methyltransferase BioC [Rickettsiella grylli]
MINTLDEIQIACRFNKAAKTYDEVAILQQRVGEALLDRLRGIRLQPQTVLDLGCGTGYFTALLKKLYPTAKIIGLDKSNGMLKQAQIKEKKYQWSDTHWINGTAEYLPFNDHRFELVYSNLMLHWSYDLKRSLNEIRRILKPGGLLLFSMVGPDTLKELRDCWKTIDHYTHVHLFLDMHDLGDHLLQASFVDSVVDLEYFTLLYSEVLDLLKELKKLGVQNLSHDRRRSLTSKGSLNKLLDAYEAFRNSTGKLPATWEIIYGHAWSIEKKPKQNSLHEIKIPLKSIIRG